MTRERIVRRKRTSRLKREDDLIIGAEEEGEKRGGEEECKWEESTLKTPSRETSLEGFKEDDSSYKRAPRDGQWQSAFKIAVSSPCSTKNKMSDLWENSTAKVYNRQVYSDFTSRRRLH